MDRISRMLGNVFASPAPVLNGNGAKAVTPLLEAKSLPFARGDFWPINDVGGTVDVADRQRLAWYSTSWLAYVCMRYRAQKLIEAPLWVAEENDGEESWVDTHELEELLERPNPDMEMADLLELLSLYLDSTGAALFVKNRDRGKRVGSLYPYSADEFDVHTANGRLFGRFEVRTASGVRTYGPDDVIYFRNANPADMHGATAPLQAALNRLGMDQTLARSIKNGLQNVVTPGLSVVFPETVTIEQAKEWQAHVDNTYAAARNRGKTFMTGGGAELQKHDISLSGLAGGDLMKEIEAAVCGCFQLPPVVVGAYVGLTNSSDRHNLETSVQLVYDNAILPTWSRMEKALTRGLLREVDPDTRRFIRFDKSKIGALQDNLEQKSKIAAQLRPELDLDERRALLGYAPVTDEQREEISASRNPLASFEPKSVVIYTDPPAGKAAQRPEAKAIDSRWAVFDALTSGQEFAWQLASAGLLADDQVAVLAAFERAKSEHSPAEHKAEDDEEEPAPRDLVRRMIREIEKALTSRAAAWKLAMQPLTDATARRAVQRMAAEIGIDFDLLQPALLEYVQDHSAHLVTQVTDTTKQAIRDALEQGLEDGESIPKLAARIRESGAFAKSRSELIARTETVASTNGAQRQSLSTYSRETGRGVTKQWLATRDGRTREEHAELDGETRKIDEAFSNGLSEPSEPNCRCTLIYDVEEAA